MDLQTITLPKEEALRQFERYRTLVKRGKRRTLAEEDAALLAGYEVLSRGKVLIELAQTMRAAGLDNLGRPKLAIVRADAKWVWYSVRKEWAAQESTYLYGARFGMDRGSAQTTAKEQMRAVLIPLGTWGEAKMAANDHRAMVPIIPPPIRPPASNLHQFHVLWEAAWQAMVPRDPALLRRVTGTLYAVLATWELTALEQAILGMVRNGR